MKNKKCIIEKVGSRGTLFTYSDLEGLLTTVYLIECPGHVYVIDTFLGPGSMTPVLEHIDKSCPGKPAVVFNTHYHWDQVWGNCAFPGAIVASHRLTRQKMAEAGQKELDAYGQYRRGEVRLVMPGLTFDSGLAFEDDGVEFFHSPGHTEDSSSCLDRVDGVLLVGDNVEMPLPFLNWDDLEAYRKTLEGYKQRNVSRIIAGHCLQVTTEVLDANIRYLEDFQQGRTAAYETGASGPSHSQNIQAMAKLSGARRNDGPA